MDDLTTLTDADLDALRIAVLTEQERRDTIATAQRQADDLAARYEQATADEAPIPHADLPDAIGPGHRIVWTDGETWRNTSGAWLPKTANPDTYPIGWQQETGLPETVPEWASGDQVAVGDLRSYGGITYRVVQSHTTQTGWEPPSVPALWTVA